jgi:RND superfamily putative drug exporter
VMCILGRANWWAPRPLTWLHRRIGAGESSAPIVPVPVRG